MFTPEEYSEINLFLKTQVPKFETKINRNVWDPRLFENTQGYNEVTIIGDTYFDDLIINRMIERFNTTQDFSKYSIIFYKNCTTFWTQIFNY